MRKIRIAALILLTIILSILATTGAFAKFRFAVMADSRKSKDEPVNIEEFRKVLAQMKKISPQPQFVFFPGDMVRGMDTSYSGMTHQYTVWKNAVTAYYPISIFYLGVGNHETNNGDIHSHAEIAFADIFPEFKPTEELLGYNRTVYYLDYDNSRLFMLNTNHTRANHQVDSTQREWLAKNLNQKPHDFIFMHEPAYPTSSHIGSSLDVVPAERDAFWDLVDDANATLVFVGHEHYYARRHIDNAFNSEYKNKIYQVTTGSCGAPTYTAIALNMLNKLDSNKRFLRTTNIDVHPISVYHFAIVDVAGKRVTTTVYNVNGKIIDRFTVYR